jgi:hypothetical protein
MDKYIKIGTNIAPKSLFLQFVIDFAYPSLILGHSNPTQGLVGDCEMLLQKRSSI